MWSGNIFALVQTNVKRMLAYSSIAHAGYLLGGVGAMGWSANTYPGQGVLIYLAAYTFMNLGAFGVLAYLKTQMPGQVRLLAQAVRGPWAGVRPGRPCCCRCSCSRSPGSRERPGFIGKFYVFGGMVRADLMWLAVIGVVLSAVSAYYYLRVIIYMFFREPEEEFALRDPISGSMAAALAITAVATLAIGIVPSRLWDAVVSAFVALFS